MLAPLFIAHFCRHTHPLLHIMLLLHTLLAPASFTISSGGDYHGGSGGGGHGLFGRARSPGSMNLPHLRWAQELTQYARFA